ncbi:NADP-dependent phosphogluconate dehydrogenase [Thermus scotoductus]|uniref:6-phosphogluconate dehydrogenase family protein n=1 Tax=Thermus scotoductus (strain ATCC 700910 / SA-01) TaxID=743525 RepID=E8PQ83_THESS|nr:NADP-dependent phosphogluconate dehydrogenase [Thermus scotoductus]ADW21742.1 6-phosphogluconate dehydrogenase family protein [Thermus scotoductus SA-01]
MLGLIGLGRMGLGMAKRWRARSLPVVGYDPDLEAQAWAGKEGIGLATSLVALAGQLPSPKTFWLMVPAGAVDSVLEGLTPHLSPGDLVVDGGNSFYRESQRRGEALAQKGVGFVDVGVSGGLWGAKEGYGLMVGGEARWVARLEPYLAALAPEGGWVHAGTLGAGHYTKMVHNGVEYALMEAYAEGAELLYAGREELGLDPARILSAWRQGTIVRSFLLDRLAEVVQGPLEGIAPLVEDSGEGRWAVEEGLRRGVALPAMAQALFVRWESQGRADLRFRLLALLRRAFGGHAVRREDEG